MYFASDDRSQNMLELELKYVRMKKDKGTDYVLSSKSTRVYTSKLLYTTFFHSIKCSG